jgi:hypothetical protein
MQNSLDKYFLFCPTAKQILKSNLKFIGYDHIAIRSLNNKYYYSGEFINIIKQNNYKKMDDIYNFPKYNVNATWYKQNFTQNNIPRIFASWHDANLNFLPQEIENKMRKKLNLTFNEYLDIYNKNQYVAWTYLFSHDINHIAMEVDDIEYVTEKLISRKYKFNDEGGIYKISKDKNLIQTSIMADQIELCFDDKKAFVPYSFIEFAQRKNNRDGFETESANKIFSSTKNKN